MVKTPHYPLYKDAATLMGILEGERWQHISDLQTEIYSMRGTPQDPVNWENPDEWIHQKLKGKLAVLAERIWVQSDRVINPRYIRSRMFLINGYELAKEVNGNFRITDRGKVFIGSSNNEVIRAIDLSEGLVQILLIVSRRDIGKRQNFIADWEKYLEKNSNVKKDSVSRDYLRRRLVNLADRQYLLRTGNSYSITPLGIKYLTEFDNDVQFEKINEEISLVKEADNFNSLQKKELQKILETMNPFQLEQVIKDLLEAMGYYDVIVTSPTNDKGVDVAGTIKNGISEVREVIQVKRVASNIGRPILDALRGSLHRFHAFKGTIITTGDFAKGTINAAFETGAAPITLINGDRLIELLIENEIGITPQTISYFIINNDYFENDMSESENEN